MLYATNNPVAAVTGRSTITSTDPTWGWGLFKKVTGDESLNPAALPAMSCIVPVNGQ